MVLNIAQTNNEITKTICRQKPSATARVRGSEEYKNIRGTVNFYKVSGGVLVLAEIFGLPVSSGNCKNNIFAFHIHEGKSCSGDRNDPFKNTGSHYNPDKCPHPAHAGDLPPLFGNNGYAWNAVVTDRFTISDIIGRTVVIHKSPDDFTTQPSGNAGAKIACGEIKRKAFAGM